MARTSNRRWKGCQLCKPHKHGGQGDGVRIPFRDARKFGKLRRINRHDADDRSSWGEPSVRHFAPAPEPGELPR